jgi:hypothetical protein
VELSSLDNNLDNTLFDFDSVNWEATESLARAAIERTQIDGGKIDKILVERNLAIGDTVTKSGHVQWTIDVSNPREHATAYADPQGQIVRLDLSHTSRAAKFTLFSAAALREAVSQIDAFCGGHARVMHLEIADKWLRFKAPDPKTGEISQYNYDINGVTSDVISTCQVRTSKLSGSCKTTRSRRFSSTSTRSNSNKHPRLARELCNGLAREFSSLLHKSKARGVG